ncbi:YopX family protein [Enterococcus gilvus]|uniref:YopX family protein n=1 Tax=Enterococcus gilvus TaxID=160453 RepID=UPI003D6C236A
MKPKFRAWDEENKKMHDVVSIWFDDYSDQHKLGHINVPNGETVDTIFDDYILMQSTGLKDKNGVEIFEGDVCKIQRIPSGMKPIFVVSDYIKGKLIFSKITILGQNSYEEQGGYTGNFLEVIGNIYNNPELLEVEG